MQNFVALLLFAGFLSVLVSLGLGLFFLSKKDEKSRRMSNKVMRFRVMAQFFTLAMIVLLLIMKLGFGV